MGTDRNDKVTIGINLLSSLPSLCVIDWIWWGGGMSSGVATPGHTRASAHVKITGARVIIMWKAKVKDQVWSQVSCRREVSILVRLNKWCLWPKMASQVIFRVGVCPRFPSRCVLHTHWVCPCCAHITCSSWLPHWGWETHNLFYFKCMHSIPSLCMIHWISQTWFTSQELSSCEFSDAGCSCRPDFKLPKPHPSKFKFK